MEPVSGVLAGLGVFGIIGAVLLGTLLGILIPVWAIIDCAASRRERGTKALIIILLIFFWSFASLIYGIFFTDSRALRRFTIISLLGLVILIIFSTASLIGGASIHSGAERERRVAEEEKVIANFTPDSIDAATVQPFKAIHFVFDGRSPSSASVADFTIAGPLVESALNIDDRIRHLVHDQKNDRYYGLTQHEFGVVSPTSRTFKEIAVDPSLEQDFSWPKGLAMDPGTGEIIVLTSHVDTDFFLYNPAKRVWRKIPTGLRGRSFVALTYSPDDRSLYALESTDGPAISSLRRFNRAGADLGTLSINPPIPFIGGRDEYLQIAFSSGKIVLVVPPDDGVPPAAARKSRIFVIDPREGRVSTAKE